jgi:asparagine N-glycosylation enzyme membrane subunit Stt3
MILAIPLVVAFFILAKTEEEDNLWWYTLTVILSVAIVLATVSSFLDS